MVETLNTPCLLVAMPQLQDINFSKTVLLLVEHNAEGAMGFVLNRRLDTPLNEIVLIEELDIPDTIPAWVGGPVGGDNGLVLHNQDEDGSTNNIAESIGLSSSESLVCRLVEHAQDPGEPHPGLYPYRFLVGYAGWGPDQLDNEIREGAWIKQPLSYEIVFNTHWKEMWTGALNELGIRPELIAPVKQTYLN